MSIKSVELLPSGASVSLDNLIRRTYTHEFHIKTDDKWTLQPELIIGCTQANSPGPHYIPALWTTYASFGDTYGSGTGYYDDSYVFLQDVRYTRMNDGQKSDWYNWKCTCTWKYPDADGHGGSNPPTENPLDEPIRYHVEMAPFQKIVDKEWDYDGTNTDTVKKRLLQNSAADGFNPPLVIDDFRPVLVAIKNWDGTDLTGLISLITQYKNAVNDDTFYDAAARCAKVESIVGTPLQERNGVTFYQVTFRIQFDENTWDIPLIDRGTQHLTGNGTKQYPIKTEWDEATAGVSYALASDVQKADPGNYKIASPLEYLDLVNLNSDGTRKYPDEEPADQISPAFRVYPELDFSGLGIGTGVGT